MGEDVSYRSASWDDMGRAIAEISGWGGALERMRQMDRTFQQIQNAIDDLDEDRRLWFSYKSQAGALDKLGQDYRKLDTFTGEAGDAVSRQIDDPFYKQMDAFVAEMAQIAISQYHAPNTLNVKEYQAASPLASVTAYEQVTKQSITFDDLLNGSSLMAASLKKEYEAYRAAAGKQAGGVTFDQYKEGIQYSRGFDYRSIKDKQMDQEFWVNLGIGAAVVILTIACPPAGIAAGAAYGAMQLADAATGTSLISGRKLSTEERVTEGIFGVLDAVPAFKAAGAFSAIGRMGTKGVTSLGGLTKTMGRASVRRLIQLKQISHMQVVKARYAASNLGEKLPKISLSGSPQLEAAGVSHVGGGDGFIQNLQDTFQKASSKNIGSAVKSIAKNHMEDGSQLLNNGKTLDEMATFYASAVKSNKKWSWLDDIPGGEFLSKQERVLLKEYAVKMDWVENVPIRTVKSIEGKTYKYARFESAGLVQKTIVLPKKLWKSSDSEQFKWLDEKIGGRPQGTTWHHKEKDGIMELVDFGIHNITNHNGGRTVGHWAYRPEGR